MGRGFSYTLIPDQLPLHWLRANSNTFIVPSMNKGYRSPNLPTETHLYISVSSKRQSTHPWELNRTGKLFWGAVEIESGTLRSDLLRFRVRRVLERC